METNNPTASQATFSDKISILLQQKPVILQLLRFAAIGVINTALDFIVLNVLSKTLHITAGLRLGQVNVIGFSLAVVQSYFWNKYWAFNLQQAVSLWKNFVRLVVIGALGTVAVLSVLLGSSVSAPVLFYAAILGVFLILELVCWQAFGLGSLVAPSPVAAAQVPGSANHRQFISFLVVSLIGLAINSLLIAVITNSIELVANQDLNKNIAKVAATGASLVWNFVGYKIFVFKR